ncbi:MAG: fumarylacetoacetate hydrolase family protein [Methylotenera sp.]|nr:fumarylacetoacetate hydrolase family protein [Oligoflexia bacterium]
MDKLICVGKNYSEHVQELAKLIGDSVPEKPVLFLKPPSVLVAASPPSDLSGSLALPFPEDRGAVHPECEIVIRLRSGGYRLSPEQALASMDAVTLGLDMTLRDVQSKIKKAGGPWEVSKIFPGSAVTGPWISLQEFPEFAETEFTFSVNGSVRQKGKGTQMSLSPAECIAYASEHFPLCAGDLVFTGTPAGVGPVQRHDRAELQWSDRLKYQVHWI